MRVQHRMKPKSTRSHKGYISIPIIHSKKRRNGSQSPSTDSSSSLDIDDDKEKSHANAWKAQSKRIATFIVIVFVVLTILIYMKAPAGNSPLPRENIAQHELHSSRNSILSPRFSIPESMITSIPQIDPLQMQHSLSINIHTKKAIVYFLEDNNNFCALLLSISSVLEAAANTSSDRRIKFQIIVFIHYQFDLEALDLDKVATSMNFKLMKYELSGRPKLEYMIRRLADEHYDSVIYADVQSFILQDLSVLFGAITKENSHLSGIWSFQENGNGQGIQSCFSPSILVINIARLRKRNIQYAELFQQHSLCDKPLLDNDNLKIESVHLSEIQGVSEKYGIVALPWWYAMDQHQFALYYGNHDELQNENERGILSWFFQSNADSEVVPLLIDLSRLDASANDNTFLSQLTSIRHKAIDFCRSVSYKSE